MYSSAPMLGRPWTSKPPRGTPINWRNPVTRGLAHCWPFNEGGGQTLYDVVGSAHGTTTLPAAATWASGGAASQHLPALRMAAVGNAAYAIRGMSDIAGGAAFSLGSVFANIGTGTANAFFSMGTQGVSRLRVAFNGTALALNIAGDATNTTLLSGLLANAFQNGSGQWYVGVITFSGAFASAQTVITAYLWPLPSGPMIVGSATLAIGSGNTVEHCGLNGIAIAGGAATFSNFVAFQCLWRGAIPQDQAAAFCMNPYQMFAPPTTWWDVGVSAAVTSQSRLALMGAG